MRGKIAIVMVALIVAVSFGCKLPEEENYVAPDASEALLLTWESGITTESGINPIDMNAVKSSDEWSKFGSSSMRAIPKEQGSVMQPSWYVYDYPERVTNWSFATWLYYTESLLTYDIVVFNIEWISVAGNGIEIECRSDNGVLYGQYELYQSWNVVDSNRVGIASNGQMIGEHYIAFHFDPSISKLTFVFDGSAFDLQTKSVEYNRLEGYWDNFHIYSIYDVSDSSVNLYYDDTYFAYESLLTVGDLINHYNANVSW